MEDLVKRAVDTFDNAKKKLQPALSDFILCTAHMLQKRDFWISSGMKTFILSKELIDAFQNTDVSWDLRPDDFKYPFDSFVIEGESPFFYTKSKDLDAPCPVYSIMFTRFEEMAKKHDLIIDIHTGNPMTEIGSDYSINAFFSPGEDVLNEIFLNLNNGMTLKKASENVMITPTNGEATDDDMSNLCNMLFNTVLYINDPSRDVASTQSIHSRKIKIDGKTCVKNQYIRLCPPKSYKPIYSGSGKTLNVKFIVRGHWRNQACGKDHLDRKRMWIYPYWKGPEMSEIVNRKYKL